MWYEYMNERFYLNWNEDILLKLTDRTEDWKITKKLTEISPLELKEATLRSYTDFKKDFIEKNWFILSKWNTIWWSIAINDKYVLPWGKKLKANNTNNYYYAWLYDMNFLRRYHYIINQWRKAKDPIKWSLLSDDKFGTNPVVIFYDPAISSAYWF